MKIASAMREGKKHIQQLQEKRQEKIRNDLKRYGSKILNSDEMQEAFSQTHHLRSTVGDHTQRVAEKSLAICHALEKLHIRTDIPAVVAGSLCHDLGILGREEKYGSGRECYRQHAADSVEIARKLVDDLPGKTEEIIRNHMWPTPGSKMPHSLEATIVSVADKAVSVEDFLRGSKTKPAGLKATAREFVKTSRGYFTKPKK